MKSQQLTQASAFHNYSLCWTHFLVNLSKKKKKSHLPSERLNISQCSLMSLRSTWSTQIQIWTQLRIGGTAMWRFSWIDFQACQIQDKNSYTFIRLVWKTNVAKKYVWVQYVNFPLSISWRQNWHHLTTCFLTRSPHFYLVTLL